MRFYKGHTTWNKGICGEESHMFGRKMSEQSKIKLGNSRRGIKFSEEHRQKLSISAKNRKSQPTGKDHGAWKGGKYFDIKIKQFRIYMPEHPSSNINGYILENRLVAERAMGRYLKRSEVVHHINGNPKDNKSSNLLICTQSYHFWLHWKMKKLGITF